MPQTTVPGEVEAVSFEHLNALAPGGPAVHFGFPPGAVVEYGELLFPGTELPYRAVILTPSTELEPGDIWLVTIAQLTGRLVRDGLDDDHETLNWMAGRLTQALVQAATQAWGFVPFVYTASAETQEALVARPAHALVSFSGIFGALNAPVEIWSWGLTFLSGPDVAGSPEDLATKASEAYNAVALLMPTYVIMTKARVAFLGDGRHVDKRDDGSYNQGDSLVARPGFVDGSQKWLPLQTALCVSYYTPRPGSSGRGRSFLPLNGRGLGPDFLLDPMSANQFATAVKTIAGDMETGAAKLGRHSVISGGTKANNYQGYTSPVTSYRCGLVPDTMRTRRNALKEAYRIVAE